MPTILKVLIIIAIPFLIIGGLRLKNRIWPPKTSGIDYAKALSLQTSAKDDSVLKTVNIKTVDVKYINRAGEVETRPIIMYIPDTIKDKAPLVYVPHYEIGNDSAELFDYLKEGWIVASPTAFQNSYNGKLTNDDLVFNNAAMYTLRNMPEIDCQRIATVGGSAGGYTTLMLDTQQMGICASIANSPISNVYFIAYQYYPDSTNYTGGNKRKAMLNGIWKAITVPGNAAGQFFNGMMQVKKMPILGMIAGGASRNDDNFPKGDDITRWEALSPVALAGCFTSQLVINHCTSDILVPVDQISKEYTYAENGDTMPEGFVTRLDESNPGKLGRSLQEELDKEETEINHIVVDNPEEDRVMTFNSGKRYTINIIDDGPTQSYGSHSVLVGSGKVDQMPYLREMMSKTVAATEVLTNEKLLLLLRRYQGKSIQLPVHEGVDESAYGSLTIYQKEVVDELSLWANNHSVDELKNSIETAISTLNADEQPMYKDAWNKISAGL